MTKLVALVRLCTVLVVVVALVAVVQPATASVATVFTTSFTDGGNWSTVYVQGFKPSIDASPDPGLGAGDTVYLKGFDFFKSGNADNASNIQLAILDTIWYDFNTPLTTSSSALLGLSTNTIASTASIATGDPVSFSFNSVPLAYGGEYAAVAVNVDGSGGVTPVKVSALTANYVEDPPGTWKPATNYGGESVWQFATSDSITGGYFGPMWSYAGDAKFVATLSTIPEPCSAMLGLCGAILVALAGRRR